MQRVDSLEVHNSGGSIHAKLHRPRKLILFLGFKDKLKVIAFEKYLNIRSGRVFSKKMILAKRAINMAYTVLYIAASQDGFIADKHGNVDWLPQEAPEGEDFGFDGFLASIDVIAQGSRTFIQSVSFIDSGIVPDLPYGGKHMYVFTREPMTTDRSDVTFVSSIQEYLKIISQDPMIKRVWLLGGAELIASFKNADLIDECIITVIPKVLGEGISLPSNLFDGMSEVDTRQLFQGILEKRYACKRD